MQTYESSALRLLRLLGASRNETLLAGDHWLDAECARRARLRFVLVTKPDQDMGAGKGFDYYAINSIRDVVDLASP